MVSRVRFPKTIKGILSLLPSTIRSKIYRTNNADLGTPGRWIHQRFRYAAGRNADTMLGANKSSLMVMTKRA